MVQLHYTTLAKVPEKLIQQRNGHQSLKALRQYMNEHLILSYWQFLTSSVLALTRFRLLLQDVNHVIKTKTKYAHSSNTAVTQKSDEITIPAQQFGPTVAPFLKGCSFMNCNVTFTGSTTCTDESQSKFASYEAAELTVKHKY